MIPREPESWYTFHLWRGLCSSSFCGTAAVGTDFLAVILFAAAGACNAAAYAFAWVATAWALGGSGITCLLGVAAWSSYLGGAAAGVNLLLVLAASICLTAVGSWLASVLAFASCLLISGWTAASLWLVSWFHLVYLNLSFQNLLYYNFIKFTHS